LPDFSRVEEKVPAREMGRLKKKRLVVRNPHAKKRKKQREEGEVWFSVGVSAITGKKGHRGMSAYHLVYWGKEANYAGASFPAVHLG